MTPTPPGSYSFLGTLVAYLVKAHEYSLRDPLASLTFSRKSAEWICRRIYGDKVGPPGALPFEQLATRLKASGILPARLFQPLRTVQTYGNYGSHPQDDDAEVDREFVLPCIAALTTVSKWFFLEYLNTEIPSGLEWLKSTAIGQTVSNLPPLDMTIASLKDLLNWGWNLKQRLHDWLAVDYATINNLTPRNEGHVEQWLSVVLDHPQTWRLLLDGVTGRLAGYWHFVPLFDEQYALAVSGTFYDADIKSEQLCNLNVPGNYRVYMVGISILHEYQSVGNFRLLFDSLLSQITHLAEHGVFLDEICTNAFTPVGKSLCKTLGMTHVCNHQEFGQIFCLRMRPLPQMRVFEAHPQLRALYGHADSATV